MASHSSSAEWAAVPAGGHSAYKGSLFYPWRITQEFQSTFSVEFNHLFPCSCLKKDWCLKRETRGIPIGKQGATSRFSGLC